VPSAIPPRWQRAVNAGWAYVAVSLISALGLPGQAGLAGRVGVLIIERLRVRARIEQLISESVWLRRNGNLTKPLVYWSGYRRSHVGLIHYSLRRWRLVVGWPVLGLRRSGRVIEQAFQRSLWPWRLRLLYLGSHLISHGLLGLRLLWLLRLLLCLLLAALLFGSLRHGGVFRRLGLLRAILRSAAALAPLEQPT
jgi:hypothetical protein